MSDSSSTAIRTTPGAPAAVTALRRLVTGPVLTPGDDGYAEEVAGFDLTVQHHPPLAVGATDRADVVAAVRVAAGQDLPISVVGTGHGDQPAVGAGMLLTLRRLRSVRVDTAARRAVVGAGATWHDVLAATTPFGLAAVCGSAPAVGVGGFLLGGGLGPIGRTVGFASDRVRAFETVLADGSLVRASADEHPDLFWALRGGKGGFGVVTAITLDLLPLPTIYGGGEYYPADAIPALLRGFQRMTAGPVPEPLTTSVAILRLPDRPVLPPALRGRTVGHLRVGYVDPSGGGAVAAERLLAPLRRELPAPLLGATATLAYADIGTIHNDPTVPSAHATAGLLLDELSDETVAAVLDQAGPRVATPLAIAEIRHLGGALARPPAGGDAVSGRTAAFGTWISSAPTPPVSPAWSAGAAAVDRLLAAVTPAGSPGRVQVNFCGARNTAAQAAAAWSPEVSRELADIRRRYDPDQRFRYRPGAV